MKTNALVCAYPLTLTVALLTGACLPGSKSLGDDEPGATSATSSTSSTDGPSVEPRVEASVRWSSLVTDVSAAAAARAPDGSIYVFGNSGYYFPGGDSGAFDNVWLGKFDAAGRPQWEVEQPDPDFVLSPTSVTVDEVGGIYVSIIDFTEGEGGGNVIRKYDESGEEQWSTALPARPRVVHALPGGGVVAGGIQVVETNPQNVVAWAQVLDAEGAPAWSRTYGDPGARGSAVVAAATAADGSLLLAGRMGVDPVSSRSRAWVASVDLATGEPRWESLLSAGVATDQTHALGVTGDGTIVAVGRGDEAWITVLAPDGSERSRWINEVATGSRTLAVHPDGSVVVADAVSLDPENAGGCWDLSGDCPAAVRVATLEDDRSLRWFDQREDCRHSAHTVAMPDGGALVVAGCDDEADGGVATGLFVYEAQP